MLESPRALNAYAEEQRSHLASERQEKWTISVGVSECSIAKGARETYDILTTELTRLEVPFLIRRVGCGGWCWAEPFVEIQGPDGPPVLYREITPDRATTLAGTIAKGYYPEQQAVGVREDRAFDTFRPLHEHPFFGRQRRLLLENAAIIDPESIDEYIAAGGYQAFLKAITEMSPEEIIEEIKLSGVRGRGGAGFPTSIKWEGGRATEDWPKFVVVNSHEGEPNIYKDRRLIESDPHKLLEGIMIACYAVGADIGYNYIGGEHVLAVERFRKAVDQAYEVGLLGDNVLGTGIDIHVRTRLGSGAYIAGEEMGLLESLEGKQAMPRTKPPFPTVIGYRNRPTVLNNAETLANVPHIVTNGGEWYAGLGVERSAGTKLVTMQGPTRWTGLVELEMGITLHDLVFDVYGGMQPGKTFAGLQTGGVSAGPVTEEMLPDYLVDFDSLKAVDGMLGSGGFVTIDDSVCPVAFAQYLTEFSRFESCGKCTPCRLGCPALVEILGRIMHGRGRPGDIELIERHSQSMINLSLCGLGVAAPAPVLGFLKHYRAEFERHIFDKRCTAGTCPIHSTPSVRKDPRAATAIPAEHRDRQTVIPLTVGGGSR